MEPRPVKVIERELKAAALRMRRASERRRDLPAGSSRARVTTANARWATACEHYDRLLRELADASEDVS